MTTEMYFRQTIEGAAKEGGLMKRKLTAMLLVISMILSQAAPAYAAQDMESFDVLYDEAGESGSEDGMAAAEPGFEEGTDAEVFESAEDVLDAETDAEIDAEGPFFDEEAESEKAEYPEEVLVYGEPDPEEGEELEPEAADDISEEELLLAGDPDQDVEVAEEAAVTFSLDAESALVNEPVMASVTAKDYEGIKEVRIYCQELDHFWWPPYDLMQRNGETGEEISVWGEDGQYTFWAEVTYDEWNDEWNDTGYDGRQWIPSDAVTIDITSLGTIGDFTAALGKTSVRRGDSLDVIFTAAQNADHYWFDIEKWNEEAGEWRGAYYDSDNNLYEAGTLSFPTISLVPGFYRVIGQANGIGYRGHEAANGFQEFTVEDASDVSGSCELSVSKTDIETGEDIVASALAPGAEHIELFPDFSNNISWRMDNYDREVRDYFLRDLTYGDARDYTMVARAFYEDGSTVDSEPAVITVTAPKGKLVIETPADIPAFIEKGQALTFTVKKPAEAERLWVDAWYDPDEDVDNSLYQREADKDIEVSISAEKLQKIPERGFVKIYLEASARGYDMYSREIQIPVYTPDPSVQLELGKTEGLINEGIEVKVIPTGEKRMKAARIWRDDENNWLWCREFYENDFEEDGSLIISNMDWWNPGWHTVFAEVTFDDWDEAWNGQDYDGRQWIRSESKTLTLTSIGETGSLAATIGRNTLKRGERLEITFTEAEHATAYWFDLERWDDGAGEWFGYDAHLNSEVHAPGTYSFPTTTFIPGAYRVIGHAGAVGYENSTAANGFQEFSVSETDVQPGEVELKVSKDTVETCEDFEFTVLAPGAVWIELFPDYPFNGDWRRDNWFMGGGESLVDFNFYSDSREYQIVARAHYSQEDYEDYKDSAPVTMKVTAPNGDGIKAMLPDELPLYLKRGENLDFKVLKPANADRFDVNVWWDPDEEGADGTLYSKETDGESLQVFISGEKTANIPEGKVAKIHIGAWGRGYDYSEAYTEIIFPTPDAPVSVTMDRDSALVHETVQITVNVDDYTKVKSVEVGSPDRYDWLNIEDFNGAGRLVHAYDFDADGRKFVCARITYTDWDGEGDDPRVWYYSEPAFIDVSSKGQVGEFSVSVDKTEVTRGEVLTVTLTDSENADFYWIDLEKGEKQGEAEWFDNHLHKDNAGSYRLSTVSMEPGTYWLTGMARGTGYTMRQADGSGIRLVVSDPTLKKGDVQLTVDKNEIETNELMHIWAYAPGAKRIEVLLNYPDDEWWSISGEGEYIYQNHDNHQYGISGTYGLRAKAYYSDDENDFCWSDPVEIKVTAPHGKLEIPKVEGISSFFNANEDLVYTVVMPEHAESLYGEVWITGRNERRLSWFDSHEKEFPLLIPKEDLAGVETGEDLEIRMNANARGYEESHADYYSTAYRNPDGNAACLSLLVYENEGEPITDGFSVYWYTADGSSLLGSGLILSNVKAGQTYRCKVVLGEELSYLFEQPAYFDTKADEGLKEIPVQLKAHQKGLLTGTVKDERGNLLPGAAVTIKQIYNGTFEKEIEVRSDENGSFESEIDFTDTEITGSKEDYFSGYLHIPSFAEEPADAELILRHLPENKVRLALSGRTAVPAGDTASENEITSFAGLIFSAYNVTGGKAVDDLEAGYPYIIMSGTEVQPGDTVRISVSDTAGVYTAEDLTVKLDERACADECWTLVQNGRLALNGITGSSESLVMIFDRDEKCVESGTAGTSYLSGLLPQGNYTGILMKKTSMLKSVDRLSRFLGLGIKESDYTKFDFSVSNGVITTKDGLNVPELDENVLYCTVPGNTALRVGNTTPVVGQYVSFRAQYEIDSRYKTSEEYVTVVLPDGLSPVEGSLTVDGAGSAYTAADGTISIPVGRSEGVIRFYCVPTSEGALQAHAFLNYKKDGGADFVREPIGSVTLTVDSTSISVPGYTNQDTVTVSGNTLPDCDVTVYDNDEEVGSTKSDKAGSWSLTFKLVKPYEFSLHEIYAEICNAEKDIRFMTASSELFYDRQAIEVAKVTMINIDHTPKERITEFDFLHEEGQRRISYDYFPPYPTFTFKVEFTEGDPETVLDVSVVTKDAFGNETDVPCFYDEFSGCYVGTHDYESFNDVPCSIRVTCCNASFFTGERTITPERVVDSYIESLPAMMKASDKLDAASKTKNEDSGSDSFSYDMDVNGVTMGRYSFEMLDYGDFSLDDWGEDYLEIEYEDGTICYQYSVTGEDSYTIYTAYPDEELLGKEVMQLTPDASASIQTAAAEMSEEVVSAGEAGLVGVSDQTINKWADTLGFMKKTWDTVSDFVGYAEELTQLYKDLDDINTNTYILNQMIDTIAEVQKMPITHWCRCVNPYRVSVDELRNQVRLYNTRSLERYFGCLLANVVLTALTGKAKKLINQKTFKYAKKLYRFFQKKTGHSGRGRLKKYVKQELEYLADEVADQAEDEMYDLAEKLQPLLNILNINELINREYQELSDELSKIKDKVIESRQCPCLRRGGECECDPEPEPDPAPRTDPGNKHSTLPRKVVPKEDPSGYVYEAVPSNRVEGVKAEIYSYDYVTNESGQVSQEKMEVLWDAENYGEVNPQYTDSDGTFGWNVPRGSWAVKFSKDGYENADSYKDPAAVDGYLPVPPIHTEVNTAIISKAAPEVLDVKAYKDMIRIDFSQYMRIDTVCAENVVVTAGGKTVAGTIEPLNAEFDYKKTTQYASSFRFVPGSEGALSGKISVSVTGAVNYAGKALADTVTREMTVAVMPEQLKVTGDAAVGLHETGSLEIQILPAEAGANKTVTVTSYSPSIVSVKSSTAAADANGKVSVPIEGNLPGQGVILISLDGESISAEKSVTVLKPSEVPEETEQSVKEAEEAISSLPDADAVKLTDREKIKAARAAYDGLRDEQKSKISKDTVSKLEEAEAALQRLEDEKELAEKKAAEEKAAAEKKTEEKKKAVPKAAKVKVSKTKVTKGKKTTVKITSDAGTKITVAAANARAKKKKYVSRIKAGKTAKITFAKKAAKGLYKFKVTVAGGNGFKKTVKTVKIRVK